MEPRNVVGNGESKFLTFLAYAPKLSNKFFNKIVGPSGRSSGSASLYDNIRVGLIFESSSPVPQENPWIPISSTRTNSICRSGKAWRSSCSSILC